MFYDEEWLKIGISERIQWEKQMVRTQILLTDNKTGGGEPINGAIREKDGYVYIDFASFTLRVKRSDVLAAIETEEHG